MHSQYLRHRSNFFALKNVTLKDRKLNIFYTKIIQTFLEEHF